MSRLAELKKITDKINKAAQKENPDSPPVAFIAAGNEDLLDFGLIPTGNSVVDEALGGGFPRGTIAQIIGAEGTGKCLALDTPVPTPYGWTTMGEIQPGETVYGLDGDEVEVLAVYDIKNNLPCFKVRFSDGSEIVADSEHRWPTWKLKHGVREPDYTISTTEEIANTLRSGVSQAATHAILTCAPLKGIDNKLPIAPYTLGAWLGDGTCRQGVITTTDDAVLAQIESEEYIIWPWGSSEITYGIQGLQSSLRSQGLLGNKHIPSCYLRASYENRLALLQGIMDTDGSIDEENSQCEITLTNKRLAYDVYDLLLGLGHKVSINESDATLNGQVTGRRWRLHFQTELPIFRLERKAARVKQWKTRRAAFRYIVSVESTPSVPVRCISVEGGLFLCGRQYIPTCNTCLCFDMIAANQKAAKEKGEEFIAIYVHLEARAFPLLPALNAGVDLDSLIIINAMSNAEKTFDILLNYLWDWNKRQARNLVDLVVIDSVTAAAPEAEMKSSEESLENVTVGRHAAMMSKVLRILSGSGALGTSLLLMINQYRTNVGSYGSPQVATGGKAMGYYPKISISVSRPSKGKITRGKGENQEIVGHTVEGQVDKNNTQVGRPYARFSYPVIYGEGVDLIVPVIDLALKRGVIGQNGPGRFELTYNGETVKFHGKTSLEDRAREDQEFFSYLQTQIINASAAEAEDNAPVTGAEINGDNEGLPEESVDGFITGGSGARTEAVLQ